MMTTRTLRVVAFAAVVALASVPLAKANAANQETQLTFDSSVQVPGTTLEPGTYVFELADTKIGHDVVRIYDADHTKLVATAQTIPMNRHEVTSEIVVQLKPTREGSAPAALKGWFYPDRLVGHQFVYSESEAADIAKRTNTVVLATPTTSGWTGELVIVDASGKRMPYQSRTQAASHPSNATR